MNQGPCARTHSAILYAGRPLFAAAHGEEHPFSTVHGEPIWTMKWTRRSPRSTAAVAGAQ